MGYAAPAGGPGPRRRRLALDEKSIAVLTFGIPVWVVLAAGVALVVVGSLAGKRPARAPGLKLRPELEAELKQPGWKRYTSDRILGLDCEWQWIETTSGNSVDVRAILCPKCKNELRWSRLLRVRGTCLDVHCEHCDFHRTTDVVDDDPRERIAREVRRRVRAGEWKKAVKAGGQKNLTA